MSTAGALAMAVAAFVGALHPTATPLAVPIAATIGALVLRRTALIVCAVALLTSCLAARSWDGLRYDDGAPSSGVATVVTDPERIGSGHVAVLRIDGRRYQARAWGGVGHDLSRAVAGDRISVTGTLGPYTGPRERRAALHVAHRLSLAEVTRTGGGAVHWRVANAVRARISAGARSLEPARRGLYVGLVYGDDRAQDPLVAADFRLAGLTHLLAVSGQNVAYVLALAGPVLRRLPVRTRTTVALALLALFATITRFEPSVLRAATMAALAVVGTSLGREVTTLRLLALAVTTLLLIDPLLAETVAFRLSVAASGGIALGAAPLARRLPGPAPVREALSVTLAAQLAVAPVLVSVFGPISLVTVPANMLAGPAAGLVMMWGMSAGLVAGFLPAPVAAALHRPTTLMVWWLESVARFSATAPVPTVATSGLVAAIGVAACALVATRRHRLARWAPWAAAVLALMIWRVRPPAAPADVGYDSVLLAGEPTVLVLGDEHTVLPLVEDLRQYGVRRVDMVVATGPSGPEMAQLLGELVAVDAVWAHTERAGAERLERAMTVRLDAATLTIEPDGDHLSVSFDPPPPGGG